MSHPAWLTHAVDQRLALIEQSLGGGLMPDVGMVMTPLREPPEGSTDAQMLRWDRSCDNCQTYCGPGKDFYTGHVTRKLKAGQSVYITFGVCKDCKWDT